MLWHDELWLMLMQIYLKKPTGVKPLYSRPLVQMGLETHINPKYLYRKMFRLRRIDTPRLQHLWDTYASNPRKLARGVRLLRKMKGFGLSDEFYAGVIAKRPWEADFKPIKPSTADDDKDPLIPAKLFIILDLYFRLVPTSMVPDTPEVEELAREIKSTPQEIAGIMQIFQVCDPFIKHEDLIITPLLPACMKVWRRFEHIEPDKLSAIAAQLKEYWK